MIEPLDTAIRLRMPGLRFRMLDSVQVQEELVRVRVGAPTVLGAAVRQDAEGFDAVLVVKGQHLIFKKSAAVREVLSV